MATHNVNLGIGNFAESGTTGMFYHAAAGTALPAYPGESLSSAWTEVGAVSEDGINLNLNRNFGPVKNWAKKIARLLPAEDYGTVGVQVLDTTEDSLESVFGTEAVTVSNATNTHGKLINVVLTPDNMPDAEAFLFLMKDGDDMIMVGTTNGYVTEVGEVAFQPNEAITWPATITADKWVIMKDDGQVTGTTGTT